MSGTYETNYLTDITRPAPLYPVHEATSGADAGTSRGAEVPFGLDDDGAAPSATATA